MLPQGSEQGVTERHKRNNLAATELSMTTFNFLFRYTMI
jgi:hypothetical protein